MIVWPSELPSEPLINAVRSLSSDHILTTQMDSGPVKMRPKYDPVQSGQLKVSFYLTDRQAYILKDFYNITTKGVLSFSFEDIIADQALECRWLPNQPPNFTNTRGGLPANLIGTDPPANEQRTQMVSFSLEIVGPAV